MELTPGGLGVIVWGRAHSPMYLGLVLRDFQSSSPSSMENETVLSVFLDSEAEGAKGLVCTLPVPGPGHCFGLSPAPREPS